MQNQQGGQSGRGHQHNHVHHQHMAAPAQHHDPWAHPFICCDIEHAASTSTSLTGSPATMTPFPQSGFVSGQNTPGLSNPACPVDMSMFTCQDDSCTEGQVECCADPYCEEPPASASTSQHLPQTGNSTECHDCGMDELEAWACTKEGCHAIQQYLDCCNQLDCNPSTHAASISAQIPHTHDHGSSNVQTPHNTPIFPQQQQQQQQHTWPQNQSFTPSSLSSITSPMIPAVAPVVPTHVCHWQNCHQVFNSMPDLLGHVASDHLGAPGFVDPPKPVEQVQQPTTAQSQMLLPDPMMQAFTTSFTNNAMTNNNTNMMNTSMNAFNSNAGISTMPNGMNGAAHNDPLSMLSGQNPFGNDANQELLSCLWDDCLPLPECTAPAPEACPTHAHMPAHPLANHTHTATGEPFSPQTMLRHVLEEHLGVPSAILGWGDNEMPDSTQLSVNHPAVAKAHEKLHSQIHLPTPSSTHNSPSPPEIKPLFCLWPGCTHSDPFPDPATLMAHLSDCHVGKGKDSYTCQWDSCDRTFRSRQKVLRHLQSHTGHRPFVCPECEQAFGEAAPLAAHMRRHAQEKPFKCEHPGCGKTFAISSSLTIHMRTHNGEKPFVCPHCGKGFVEASNLTKHIRTHTGERPFACSFPGCGKRFPRPDQLKRHMGVHDNGSVTGRRGSKGKAVGGSH